jgi:CheY-like chemotaxis protein
MPHAAERSVGLPDPLLDPLPGAVPGPVLVVDDDPDILRVVAMTLADEGYRVLTATNGEEALGCLLKQMPALVLLDLNMPVMSGLEMLERLRALDLTIPIVFMTAGYRAQQEAERHEVAGYLAKPFDLGALLRVVARFAA